MAGHTNKAILMSVLAPEPRFVSRAAADAEAERLQKAAQKAAQKEAESRAASSAVKTYVGLCLDRSSSMWDSLKGTISGFNEQLERLQDEHDENVGDVTKVSLVTFNERVTPVYLNEHVNDVEKLSEENYRPRGMTAMLDAIGYTVRALERAAKLDESGSYDDPDTGFLLVVLSDGMENCSTKETWGSIKSLLKPRQDRGNWTITYLGANQNLLQVSRDTGIPAGNMAEYTSTDEGTQSALNVNSASLTDYYAARRGGSLAVNTFYSQEGAPANLTEASVKKKKKARKK